MSRKQKLSEVGELSILGAVRKRFASQDRNVLIGIGDDAAVLRTARRKLVLTTDMMVEGVHFDLSWATPFQIGFKLISSNVSDIYAMAGDPAYALLDLAVPAQMSVQSLNRFFDGVEKALNACEASLIGGDVSASDKMVIAATLIGYAETVVRRCGASPGDGIYVSGNLGDAACGLELMKKTERPVEIEKGKRTSMPVEWNIAYPLLRKHLLGGARKPGAFRKVATAMMDISDGLLIDLYRLCRESRVGALLYEEQIPLSAELVIAADCLGISALNLAMSGGEDYELLFTAPPRKKVDAVCIGEITDRGMKIRSGDGRVRKIAVGGYQHFAV